MKILVPLDGSALAEAALPVAERIAKAAGGEVILLTVGELPEVSEQRTEEHAALRRLVDDAAQRVRAVPCEVRTDFSGNAVHGIVETAKADRVDQIVMSTHGRSGLSRWAYGSVAEAVVRASPVPVTLVRPGGEQLAAQRVLLSSQDCRQVVAAAMSLHAADERVPVAELRRLRECAESGPVGARLRAGEVYLRLLPQSEAIAEGVAFLREGDATRREAALAVLPETGDAAIPSLSALLDLPNRDVRWAASRAISDIGGSAAVPPLVRCLQSEEMSIRWVASDGLAAVGGDARVPVVRALAYEPPSATFHRAAARVLRRVGAPGHEAALDRLLRSLEHETTVVQSPPLAAELLSEMERER